MCQSPHKQIRAGWSFLAECSHFNVKLSVFHHCHTPFAPKTHGRGGNLKHRVHPCIPTPECSHPPGGDQHKPWWGLLERQSMTFSDFYRFPELPVHLLHTAKSTGCDVLSQRRSLVSRAAQIQQLFLRQNSSRLRTAAFGVTENQACFPRILR